MGNTDRSVLRIEKSSFYSMIKKRCFMWFKTFLIVSVIVYIIVSIGIARFLYVPGHGFNLIKDTDFVGNYAPKNSFVLIDHDYNNNYKHITDKIFVPSSSLSLVKVEAGPIGKITRENGYITHIGSQKVKIKDNFENTSFLKNQYIVSCVSGVCTNMKKLFIIDKNIIIGEYSQGKYANNKKAVHEDFIKESE